MIKILMGFELMAYGLAGVFIVLIVFFFMIKLLVWLYPDTSEENQKQA